MRDVHLSIYLLMLRPMQIFFINYSKRNPVLLNGSPAPIDAPVCLTHGATFSFSGRTFMLEYGES